MGDQPDLILDPVHDGMATRLSSHDIDDVLDVADGMRESNLRPDDF
jgi:hypothetical protein